MKQTNMMCWVWIGLLTVVAVGYGQDLAVTAPANQNRQNFNAATETVSAGPGAAATMVGHGHLAVVDTMYGAECGANCCGVDFGPLWASYCADKARCRHCSTGRVQGVACAPPCCARPHVARPTWHCLVPNCRIGLPHRHQANWCDGCDAAPDVTSAVNEPVDIGPPPAPAKLKPAPKKPAVPNAPKQAKAMPKPHQSSHPGAAVRDWLRRPVG